MCHTAHVCAYGVCSMPLSLRDITAVSSIWDKKCVRGAFRAYPRIRTLIWPECKSAKSHMLPLFTTVNSVRMRKPHKTILLICTLFFTDIIALNTSFSLDILTTATSITSAADVSHSGSLIPHATATTVGGENCYPSNVPVPKAAYRNCIDAVWQIPPDPVPTTFQISDFPRRYRHGGCTVTLTLAKKDTGSWWHVEWMATNAWLGCQLLYPQTLRGASTFAGTNGHMFVRIWYEGSESGTEGGVAARQIGDEGAERGRSLDT